VFLNGLGLYMEIMWTDESFSGFSGFAEDNELDE
jgi:hypothetical protein